MRKRMLVVEAKSKSIDAEAYKTLRSNIQYSSFDKEITSIVVTSAEESEGKTTVSGNLALSFSQNGKSVLLIDCDLRKPSLHKKLNLSNLVGLSDVLIGKEKLENVLQKYNENLYLLSSGKIPPNPSEMLGSEVMNHLIGYLKTKYDVIIMDTPPVQVVTDAQILSTIADGTIIIARAQKSKPDSLMEAIRLLNNVSANIIGTILNGADCDRKKNSSYYGK